AQKVVTHSKVHGQLRSDFPVILEVAGDIRVSVIAIGDSGAQRNLIDVALSRSVASCAARHSEQKVRERQKRHASPHDSVVEVGLIASSFKTGADEVSLVCP